MSFVNTGKAFEILKTWVAGRFVLPKARWDILINEVVPTRGKPYADLLWQVLDEDDDNYIEKKRYSMSNKITWVHTGSDGQNATSYGDAKLYCRQLTLFSVCHPFERSFISACDFRTQLLERGGPVKRGTVRGERPRNLDGTIPT